MKTELERYKEALRVAALALDNMIGHGYNTFIRETQSEIDAILNPQPEMEMVEVVKWVPFNSAGIPSSNVLYDTEDAAKFASHCKGQVVKVVGTYQRPKPQKVERSAMVSISSDGYVVTSIDRDRRIFGKSVCITWEE